MMTHLPNPFPRRPADPVPGAIGSVRAPTVRDILWGRPLFKAPQLPSPRIVLDPLPLPALRPTHRPPQA
jgi:hypothetical protein